MTSKTLRLLFLVVAGCLVPRRATAFVVTTAGPPGGLVAAVPSRSRLGVAVDKNKADTFRKADFVAAVAAKTGLNKKDAEVALKAVFDVVQEQIGRGRRVNMAGFGTFTLKERAARRGRNPQTGAELLIAASKSPGFSPAKAWKDAINGRVPKKEDAEEDEEDE